MTTRDAPDLPDDAGVRVLPVAGGSVVQIRVDFAFGLVIDGPALDGPSSIVRINTPFRYESGGAAGTIDPEQTERLAPLLVLHTAAVDEAFATEDGHLELRFAAGRSISVPPDPSFEAWDVAVTNRAAQRTTNLFGLPGGGISIVDRTSTGPAEPAS